MTCRCIGECSQDAVRLSGRQARQRERGICNVISTEVSAGLQDLGSSDSPSELYQSEGRRRVFVSMDQLITGHGMTLTLAVPYGHAQFPGW